MLAAPADSDNSAFRDMLARRSAVIRRGFTYWQSKQRDGRLPARSDLDPSEIPRLLSHIVLLDVQSEPLDFYYRLIGTTIVYHLQKDWSGAWMSDIPHQRAPSQIWSSCAEVATTARPLLSSIPYVGPHHDFVRGEDIILPLADDGYCVTKLFILVDFIRHHGSPEPDGAWPQAVIS